ncbi:MAG: hypothetical protein HWN65_16940 [Candidatus Helarchaeota archaeon]|nr:hypothetical protein [Candidatus Helarchaeota archaeon]
MHLLVRSMWPADTSEEVGKAYINFVGKGMPKGVRLLESYVRATFNGIEGYTIYRVKDENFVQGFKELQEKYVAFHEVVGYRYAIEPMLTAAEALPMVGLKPPGE